MALISKRIYLNNQTCMARPTSIDLNLDENNHVLCQYPFMINLDTCNESCNTPDDLSSRICVSNKIEEVELSAFNMITRINK